MGSDSYDLVRDVLWAAQRLHDAARREYLDQVCAGNESLRREVESLLAHADRPGLRTGGFLSTLSWSGESQTASGDALEPLVGTTLGPYRLLRRVGSGGMGTVFEALQPATQRLVAVKIIRAGWMDEKRIRRFQREIEALGRLRHPSIATIFDAGVTDDGRHYYAMELVRGITLEEYQSSRWRSPEDPKTRRLFVECIARLCDGIEHAHRNGVVHRDLKPSNIMLSDALVSDDPSAQEGAVKILDFGLARIAQPALTDAMTETVAIKGTLPYMSPEQATGVAERVDYRTDIYSLGVVAYKLLTGVHPYHVPVTSMADGLRAIATSSPQSMRALVPGFPRELEKIVLHALEKSADGRYQSAAAMAQDLRAFLANRPAPLSLPVPGRVLAAPYRSRIVIAALLGALLLAACGSIWGWTGGLLGLTFVLLAALILTGRETRSLRAKLATEERKVHQITSFFEEVLIAPHPERRGPDATVLEAIERAEQQVGMMLSEFPDVEGRLRSVIGNVHAGLHSDEVAERELTAALAKLAQAHGPDSLELEAAETQLIHVLQRRLDFTGAEALLRRIHARSSRERGPESPATINSLGNLAVILGQQGRLREAIPLYREALAARERARGPSSPAAVLAAQSLGNALRRVGAYEESEQLLRRALAQQTGPEWTGRQINQTRSFLAAMLAAVGRYAESEHLLEETLPILETETPPPARLLGLCAATLHEMDRVPEAHRLVEHALASTAEADRSRPVLAEIWFTSGAILDELGDTDGAWNHISQGLDNVRRAGTSWDGILACGLVEAGRVRLRAGPPEAAAPFFREAIERGGPALGEAHPALVQAALSMGVIALRGGRLSEARQWMDPLAAGRSDPGWWYRDAAEFVRAHLDALEGGGSPHAMERARMTLATRVDLRPNLLRFFLAMVDAERGSAPTVVPRPALAVDPSAPPEAV